jgi:hypothetical protein
MSFFREVAERGLAETVLSYSQVAAEQTQAETVGFGMQVELVEQQTQLYVTLGIPVLAVLGAQEFAMDGIPVLVEVGTQDQTCAMLGIPETIFAPTTFFRQETAPPPTPHLIFATLHLGTFLDLLVTPLTLAIAPTGQHLLLDARPATHNTLGCSSQ